MLATIDGDMTAKGTSDIIAPSSAALVFSSVGGRPDGRTRRQEAFHLLSRGGFLGDFLGGWLNGCPEPGSFHCCRRRRRSAFA